MRPSSRCADGVLNTTRPGDDGLKLCFDLDDKAYYHYLDLDAAGNCRPMIQTAPWLMRGKHIPGLSTPWDLSPVPTVKAAQGKNGWTLDVKLPLEHPALQRPPRATARRLQRRAGPEADPGARHHLADLGHPVTRHPQEPQSE